MDTGEAGVEAAEVPVAKMEVDDEEELVEEMAEGAVLKEEEASSGSHVAAGAGSDVAVDTDNASGDAEAVSRPQPRQARKRSLGEAAAVKTEPVGPMAGHSGVEIGPPTWRHCELPCCRDRRPLCISLSDARCSLSDVTARWWHLSAGEHFCQNCRDGLAARRCPDAGILADFAHWLRQRPIRAQEAAQHFMAASKLPYWLRCARCGKWRQLPRRLEGHYGHAEWVAAFRCELLSPSRNVQSCEIPEDERVTVARSQDFLSSISYQPLLQSSPVADLFPDYAPHTVGLLGPPAATGNGNDVTKAPNIPPFLRPFVESGSAPLALQMPPDEILPQEALECEELTSQKNLRPLYLGVRNLIIGLWSQDVKEWLAPSKLASALDLRGLLRIPIVERCLPRLASHLTERGIINFGLLPRTVPGELVPLLRLPKERRHRCVIIGAGLTGLICARQLHKFGCTVTVLEANDRPGGRHASVTIPPEIATRSSGEAISMPLGQHLLHGFVNNPVSVLAHQAGMRLLPVADTAVLMSAELGGPVPASVEHRSEFHFLAVCEKMRREREAYLLTAPSRPEDRSFEEEYVKANRRALEKLTDMTEDHLSLLRFFEADLEAANAARMADLSWLHWDCAESYSQFGGGLTSPDGDPNSLQTLCDLLADGLDVRYNCHVTAVEEAEGQAVVAVSSDGGRFVADRVAHSGPWTQLWRAPGLSGGLQVAGDRGGKAAAAAAERLGRGRRETLLLLFRRRFWDGVGLARGQHFFGRVGGRDETRGLCHLFEDLDPERREVAALGTVLFGDALQVWAERPLPELVSAVVTALAALFPAVPTTDLEPLWSHRTTWCSDARLGHSQGFWAVGSTTEDCAVLAQPQLHNRFFFIGEGAFSNFSQTPAGSVLSGLSAAYRLAAS